MDRGCRRFLIGLGGSCTNDAGAGLVQALGARLFNRRGEGASARRPRLERARQNGSSRFRSPPAAASEIVAGCDVTNPLLGLTGATSIYALRREPRQLQLELEGALEQFAFCVKRDLGRDISQVPGGGAAGGAGAGMMALLSAELQLGIDLILQALHFDRYLAQADLVLTGEGRLDRQTVANKAPLGVARAAKAYGLPVLAVVGSLGEGYGEVHEHAGGVPMPSCLLPMASRRLLSTLTLALSKRQKRRCVFSYIFKNQQNFFAYISFIN